MEANPHFVKFTGQFRDLTGDSIRHLWITKLKDT